MDDQIRSQLTKAIETHVFPGCVLGIITSDEKRVIPVGRSTYEHDAIPITAHAVYDVASITKAIPTSCIAIHFIDSETLSLDQTIIEFIPELETNYREEITVWHLLTQTLHFHTPLSSLVHLRPHDLLHEIFTTQFSQRPGEVLNYSNAASILLGLLLERVGDRTLDKLADDIFFNPLGMQSTSFNPDYLPKDTIVPTEHNPKRRRIVQGEVQDESAFRLREIMTPGSAGLFSTVPDLLIFLEMLLQKGIYRGRRYFSEEMITAMATNQLGDIGEYVGLGWELYEPRYMGKYCSRHTFGKTGFSGCVIVGDMDRGIGFVMLSNYHFPERREAMAELNEVRRAISDMIFTK